MSTSFIDIPKAILSEIQPDVEPVISHKPLPFICNPSLYSFELSALKGFKLGIEQNLTRRFTLKSDFVLDSTHGFREVKGGVRFYPVTSPFYPQGEFLTAYVGANLTEKWLLGIGAGKKVYLEGRNDPSSSSRSFLTCMFGVNGSPSTRELFPVLTAGIGIEI